MTCRGPASSHHHVGMAATGPNGLGTDGAIRLRCSDAHAWAIAVEVANEAYESACREVFDIKDVDVVLQASRRRQALADLEAAEDALRRFRARRVARESTTPC